MREVYTDAERMELRSHVNLAGEAIAKLWPLRTFISRNPLQGFEHLPFEDAVRQGADLYEGQGYMPLAWFQEEWRKGRITPEALSRALAGLATDTEVPLGNQHVSHIQVLKTALIHGLCAPSASDLTYPAHSDPAAGDAEDVERYRAWAEAVLPAGWRQSPDQPLGSPVDVWVRRETAADWCDRTLGTHLREQINRELIKWLAPFCDEGEATWAMPYRERTFFRAWKTLAPHDLALRLIGLSGAAAQIRALPDRPEDALLQSLEILRIPSTAWQDYLARHLAALPGWAGFIKWRADQASYPWQEAHRIDLVKYLAVRLFYEREFVATTCGQILGCEGHVEALGHYARQFPHAFWFSRALQQRSLPLAAEQEVSRLQRRARLVAPQKWEDLGARWFHRMQANAERQITDDCIRTLLRLVDALRMAPAALLESPPSSITTLLDWLKAFPLSVQQATWLEAYEYTYARQIVGELGHRPEHRPADHHLAGQREARPLAQFAFCIDVRSEVYRRHLEQRGGYETFGFAGFFGLPVSFRSLDEQHEVESCPVLLKPKHLVREVARTHDDQAARRRKVTQHAAKAGQELLHDLKHNVITPYVTVEAVGWFFGVALIGRTLAPRWYHRLKTWIARLFVPPVSTTVTVDKLSREEAEEMVAVDQRRRILGWLRHHHHVAGAQLTPERLEAVRLQTLGPNMTVHAGLGALGQLLGLSHEDEQQILDALITDCGISPRSTANKVERFTRAGFTATEQAYYVETALRLMGLTSTFARLVFLCGHTSTSQNNPYESSLDCGACGGNGGLPNARTFATIANRPRVRELLAARGITIPPDTHFVAALHDTTTDLLTVADVEDVPATHRRELAEIMEDVARTTEGSAAERYERLSHTPPVGDTRRAIQQRSHDWSQVRPEWGLARNSLFVIGRRQLTQGTNLEGRAFLHSYDYRIDGDGKLLEIIMTAPLIVAQWINLEYYFSAVAPETFGSGSKVYHNLTGRIGVMTGSQSDLRMGLPRQSLLRGHTHYHIPMRLTAVIDAPRSLVDAVIQRQPLLQQLFYNRWLKLIVLDPAEKGAHWLDRLGWTKMDEAPIELPGDLRATGASLSGTTWGDGR